MNLQYLHELEDLIARSGSENAFKELYKKHFNVEPDEKLINNYANNVSQMQYFEDHQDSSYDDSYDDSY